MGSYHLKSSFMKRLALLIGIVMLSMNVFAQSKGEMYILTSASASFGQIESNTYNSDGTIASTTKSPLNTNLGLNAGFGWFMVNNCRVELSLGVFREKRPREQTSTAAWLYNKFNSFDVCPSLSYYVRLADRFYYTPEIGVDFTYGKYLYEESYTRTLNYPYRGVAIYANLLAFEYRVGPHFGLWASVGSLNHYRWRYYYDGKVFYSSSSTVFNLNGGTIAAHIYF